MKKEILNVIADRIYGLTENLINYECSGPYDYFNRLNPVTTDMFWLKSKDVLNIGIDDFDKDEIRVINERLNEKKLWDLGDYGDKNPLNIEYPEGYEE